MSWRVARSLDVLLEEINAAAPTRSKVSDGSIGDAAHASRSSDHNPWVTYGGQGIVRARDFTADPDGGLDCNTLAESLAALIAVGGHPACRSGAYVIWQRRIYSFDRRAEGWRPYSGSNPHDHHLHLSVAIDPAGFDSTLPWFVMVPKEDDMKPEDITEIVTKTVEALTPVIREEIAANKLDVGRKAKLSDDKVLESVLNRLVSIDDTLKAQSRQAGKRKP